ncbi:hypothetical protein D3C87_1264180 [compost metagenome]
MQRAHGLLPRLGYLTDKIIEIAQQFFCPHPHALTVVGQRDAACGAVQQPGRQRGFQYGNAFADVGRRVAKFFSSAGEAIFAHDGEENLEVFGQGELITIRVHTPHTSTVYHAICEGYHRSQPCAVSRSSRSPR